MSKSVTVLAPAKINLGLKVFPKRADGFHDLASIFTTVNLCDVLTVEILDKENCCEVFCDKFELPQENTFTKTYKAFCVLTGIKSGVSVKVQKHIPAGGGLGGGSTDASSFLYSIDKLFNTNLSSDDKCKIAGIVGSDCYFFTNALEACNESINSYKPYAAVVQGRGEIVHSITQRSDYSLILVFPNQSVSTKIAYESVDNFMAQNHVTLKAADFDANTLVDVYNSPIKNWNFVNDFTKPICQNYQEVQLSLEALKQTKADFVDMSGSGSTVFGVFADKSSAEKAYEQLKQNFNCVLV